MEKLKYKNMLWTELLRLKKYSVCGFLVCLLSLQMVVVCFSTQKIGLFSFYLVHYKFYFKAHKITKYNLTQISKYCFVRQ